MFIGHFGLAFASKKITQQPSLAISFLAAQFIDLLWPFFILFGIESVSIDPGNTVFTPLDFESYPYSHSLLAVFIWSVILAAVYFMVKKKYPRCLGHRFIGVESLGARLDHASA